MGHIGQGRRRLRPDCECQGTPKSDNTQENIMKNVEKTVKWYGNWGARITKHRKNSVFCRILHGILQRIGAADAEEKDKYSA